MQVSVWAFSFLSWSMKLWVMFCNITFISSPEPKARGWANCLSHTYTSIALDTRLLAQPYQPIQVELSSPANQNSCRGLIRGLIPGLIFSCPALPRSWSRPGEKTRNICKKIVKIKKLDLFFHILPDSNQNRTENTAKNIKISIFYTEFLHTKWRQRQTLERHDVTTMSKRRATFSRTKGSAKWSVKAALCVQADKVT